VLTTTLRAVPARHRSMWATFEYSWHLLSEEERQVFPRLSVFRGGFDEEAAASIAQASPQLLGVLVDKSFLRWDGTARYDMHELVRQYASGKLEEAGDAEATRDRHAAYFLALAEAAARELRGPQQLDWLDRLEAEHDSLRAALTWSVAAGGTETGVRLAGSLWWFWFIRGYWSEGQTWLEHALSGGHGAMVARAQALLGAGWLAKMQGDYERSVAHVEQSLTLYQELGVARGIADALHSLGAVANDQADYERGVPLLEESLALYRKLDDRHGIAEVLRNLGEIAGLQGAYDRRVAYHEESLALLRALGDTRGVASTLHSLGTALRQSAYERAVACYAESLALLRDLGSKPHIAHALNAQGELARLQGDDAFAVVRYEESLALFRSLGNKWGSAMLLHNLGYVTLHQGAHKRAATCFAESLMLWLEIGSRHGIAECLAGRAGVTIAQGRPAQAVRLLGAAEVLLGAMGACLDLADHQAYVHNLATGHAQLSEAAFATANAAGRAMTLEQAIACALEGSEEQSHANRYAVLVRRLDP
jgi:tetratricopeptide (TPR) repeat protein